jgi:hypothetical protein
VASLVAILGCHGAPLKRPPADAGALDTTPVHPAPSGPIVLATGQSSPGALAVDGSSVYWFNLGKLVGDRRVGSYPDGQVMKCAIDGCDDSPTVLASGRTQTIMDPLVFATNGTNVYWSDYTWPTDQYGQDHPYGLWRCETTGCNGIPKHVANTTPSGLALSPDKVYWAESGSGIFACPLSGCRGEPETFLQVAANTPLYGIALDKVDLFWVTLDTTQLYRCPLTGCNGAPSSVFSDPYQTITRRIVLDATNVYFPGLSKKAVPGIYACPKSGCPKQLAPLATTLNWGSAIATDGINVYWTDFSVSDPATNFVPGNGLIMKCAVSGCANQPTVVASGLDWPEAIALDATSLYWADSGAGENDGRIVRAPK